MCCLQEVRWRGQGARMLGMKGMRSSKSVLASTRLEDPSKKENHPTEEDGQIGTNHSLPLDRGALFNRFFGKPAHGPPHVAGGASGPIGGCRDESRTD